MNKLLIGLGVACLFAQLLFAQFETSEVLGTVRDASQRPLHGIPADAPFHLPDPALPLS